MAQDFGHIKNPLSIIAIFAGIAEVSGTIVLPHIAPDHQGTFMWFLMLFPTLIVGLFFGTLWFKHQALYAPSDWKDESNFFRDRARPSNAEEITLKQQEAIEDAAAPQVNLPVAANDLPQSPTMGEGTSLPTAQDQPKTSVVRPVDEPKRLRFARAEDLLMKRLEARFGRRIQRNMTFLGAKGERALIVDGIVTQDGRHTIIETLVSPDGPVSVQALDRAAVRLLNKVPNFFTGEANIDRKIVLAVAGRGPKPRDIVRMSENGYEIDVWYFDLDLLEVEYGSTSNSG